jgi:putative protease
MIKKPELLAPAGNFERLKLAVLYGADAVYIGGKQFGLRAFADNFSRDEMVKGIEFAHSHNRKVYVTLNIFAHNQDFIGMKEYTAFLSQIGADALILSDPGILTLVKDTVPHMEIHLSTQANCTNWKSACFWHTQGVKRIILARELSLNEIKEIRERTPSELELEAFIHGAMCISYSGRCALSNYMTGRDANRGACAQPCRWKYYLMEEKRPGDYFPVFEDERGTYLLNSNDLCMIEHIPELVNSGLTSFKIEGRMKTSYYVATVVSAYRKQLDAFFKNPSKYHPDPLALKEIQKASHRPFTTGFYFQKPTAQDHEYDKSCYIREFDFVGMVLDYNPDNKLMLVEQRNLFRVGDHLEIMTPDGSYFEYKVESMWDNEGNPIQHAPHPQQRVFLSIEQPIPSYSLLRREKE